MKVDVLLGMQWGDEGKGKIVDFLAPQYNIIARFQGGPNAGHTLEFDGIKHVLHQIPSGVFRKQAKNIIGNGVVLDPIVFSKEIDSLDKYGLDIFNNLFISKKAQLIIPTHKMLDAAYEKSKGNNKIGSTLKGIGPTYQDKIGRVGLRVGDILSPEFENKYKALCDIHIDILNRMGCDSKVETEEEFFKSVNFLKKFRIVDSEYMINDSLKNEESVLAEGAQGTLLDIDFGSYPFVTSSNTTTSGACSGLGVAPSNIGEVYGIFKAYCTRVGSGPFPTELFDETGERMREEGREFGATTGRPRRCGWLDLPALKYAVMINGTTQLFMMKTDILSIFDTIEVCVQYELEDGTVTDVFPYDIVDAKVKPIYKAFKGWNVDLRSIKTYADLPLELKEYIQFIQSEVGIPIKIISVGPDRSETIFRD